MISTHLNILKLPDPTFYKPIVGIIHHRISHVDIWQLLENWFPIKLLQLHDDRFLRLFSIICNIKTEMIIAIGHAAIVVVEQIEGAWLLSELRIEQWRLLLVVWKKRCILLIFVGGEGEHIIIC